MNFSEIDRVVADTIKDSKDRRELWVNLIRKLDCRRLCEVGVWKGELTQYLLSYVPEIEKYTLIDPWRNLPNWNKPANKSDIEFDQIFDEAMGRVSPYENKIKVVRGTTKRASESIDDRSLDLVYIDGDHTLRGITIDLQSMLPKVKQGGFIGGDDFTKTIWQHGVKFSPTEVFPYAVYFAEAHNLRIYCLPFNQFLILNVADAFHVVDHAGYAHRTPTQIYLPPIYQKVLFFTLLPKLLISYLKKIFRR